MCAFSARQAAEDRPGNQRDRLHGLAGFGRPPGVSRLPRLELEGQAPSLLERFSAKQALLSPAKIIKVVGAIVIFSSNMAILD